MIPVAFLASKSCPRLALWDLGNLHFRGLLEFLALHCDPSLWATLVSYYRMSIVDNVK